VPGKVKYKVCYHRRVLFVTGNKLLPSLRALYCSFHYHREPHTGIKSSLHIDRLGYRRLL
jgi:hypothetical protein